MSFQLRRLRGDEVEEAVAIHHVLDPDADPDPDPFEDDELWGAFAGELMLGFIAFREGWIDRLHVRADRRRAGVGSALLTVAKESWGRLSVTAPAEDAVLARFYEERGFDSVDLGGGEVRYRWVED